MLAIQLTRVKMIATWSYGIDEIWSRLSSQPAPFETYWQVVENNSWK